MPNDTVGRASGIANHVGKIFDALGVEMNLGIRLFRKSRKLLREATFRPVPAIHKGRNYGEAQIRASRRCRAVPRQERQIAHPARASASGIAHLRGARDKRS
jgi:hypothetical protein